jgi:hypothetical protein
MTNEERTVAKTALSVLLLEIKDCFHNQNKDLTAVKEFALMGHMIDSCCELHDILAAEVKSADEMAEFYKRQYHKSCGEVGGPLFSGNSAYTMTKSEYEALNKVAELAGADNPNDDAIYYALQDLYKIRGKKYTAANETIKSTEEAARTAAQHRKGVDATYKCTCADCLMWDAAKK